MKISVVVVGDLQTNCYILEKGNYVVIIDPGDDADLISAKIDKEKKVVGIIITHSHEDHTKAALELLNKYGTSFFNAHNLSEGKHQIENFSFYTIFTPGHMNDSITIYFKEEKVMFVGDFIFKGGIGRTDMLGASPYDMKKSIEKILEYPLDTTIYSGHFGMTTLADEVNNLKYFLTIL